MMTKVYGYLNTNENGNVSSNSRKVVGAFIANHSNVEYLTYDEFRNDGLLVIRSRSPMANHTIRRARNEKVQFVFIDSGHFNKPGVKKYHRIGLNTYQNYWITPVMSDRWDKIRHEEGIKVKPWRTGGNIVIVCPPSEKSMLLYNETPETWLRNTIDALDKLHPEKSIIVREKPKPNERREGNSLQEALANPDVYALATWQSGSAVEAAIEGVPVYCDKHNAAHPVGQSDFSNDVVRPDRDAWLHSLAYDNWTLDEMKQGLALDHALGHLTFPSGHA